MAFEVNGTREEAAVVTLTWDKAHTTLELVRQKDKDDSHTSMT